MSVDTGGIEPSQAAERVMPATTATTVSAPAAQAGEAVEADEAGDADEPVEAETMPPGPPPAVMAAISAAAGVYDQLHESGRHLHFGTDPQTGRVSAHLQYLVGNHLAPVTPGQVLAIASGQPA